MILYNYFFVYPICCSFYHGFANVLNVGYGMFLCKTSRRQRIGLLALRVGRRTFQFCLLHRADDPQD